MSPPRTWDLFSGLASHRLGDISQTTHPPHAVNILSFLPEPDVCT